MFIKAFIFDSNKSVSKILGYLVHGYRNPVGIGRHQLGGLIAFAVINKSGKAGRCNGHLRNIR